MIFICIQRFSGLSGPRTTPQERCRTDLLHSYCFQPVRPEAGKPGGRNRKQYSLAGPENSNTACTVTPPVWNRHTLVLHAHYMHTYCRSPSRLCTLLRVLSPDKKSRDIVSCSNPRRTDSGLLILSCAADEFPDFQTGTSRIPVCICSSFPVNISVVLRPRFAVSILHLIFI